MLFILAMYQLNHNLIKLFNHIIFKTFVGLFFAPILFGQTSYSELIKERDNTKKAEIGLQLYDRYRINDFDSLKFLAVNLLLDGSGDNAEFPRAVGEMALGLYYAQRGKIKEGIVSLKRAKEYYEKIGNLKLTSEILMEIGNAHFMSGNYEQAIKDYLKSMKIGERSTDKTLAFAAKMGLGQAYCAVGDTAVGVFSILQFKDIVVRMNKHESAANAYATLGMIEMDRNNLTLSKEYYEKSIKHGLKSSNKKIVANAYTNKAILYFNMELLDSSLIYFEKALKLRERLGQNKDIIESYFNLASYYQATDDIDNALHYYNVSVDFAKECGFNSDEVDALQEMLTIFEERGNKKEMYRIQERIDYLNEFITNKKTMDDEILDYAESLLAESAEDNLKPVEEKSYGFVWMLLGGIVLLLIFGVIRKP